MPEQKISWGVETPKTVRNTPNNPNTWGASVNSYGAGFSSVLKLFVAVWAFILPLIVWGAIAFIFANQTDGASIVVAIIGYIPTAFVLWVTSSYFVKLFDNISVMAQTTEAILLSLTRNNGGGNNGEF